MTGRRIADHQAINPAAAFGPPAVRTSTPPRIAA